METPAVREKLPRYCFEQYEMTQTTLHTTVHFDDDLDEEYEEDDEEVQHLGYWAIYDRKASHLDPIAYTESADVAQQIVDALNRAT